MIVSVKILAVDSSSSAASCAIVENGVPLAAAFTNAGLTHSQTLVSMITGMLKNAAIPLADIGLIAVTSGPGSFTGVRIGVAAVKGLAFTDKIPCAGVSTLAAMAHGVSNVVPEDENAVICATMDARRSQLYTANFIPQSEGIRRLTPDSALSVEDTAAHLAAHSGAIFLTGDGAAPLFEACRAAGITRVKIIPPALQLQSMSIGTALQGAEIDVSDADYLFPVYLRLPQAERELKAKTSSSAGK